MEGSAKHKDSGRKRQLVRGRLKERERGEEEDREFPVLRLVSEG